MPLFGNLFKKRKPIVFKEGGDLQSTLDALHKQGVTKDRFIAGKKKRKR